MMSSPSQSSERDVDLQLGQIFEEDKNLQLRHACFGKVMFSQLST
jgi:hypothetical protein